MSKKSNQDYQKGLSTSDISFDIDISLRLCEVGEYFTFIG